MASGAWGSDGPIRSYRDLTIWADGLALAEQCYALTQTFPSSELYGLVAQIRRAAVSVPVNIAEGHGREQTQQFIYFLRVAQGSLKELETHLFLSQRLGFASGDKCELLIEASESLGRRVRALIRSLQARA